MSVSGSPQHHPSWFELFTGTLWALRHRMIRFVRGQRAGEHAEHIWRETAPGPDPAPATTAPPGAGPTTGKGFRARLQEVIEREKDLARGERVQFQRRRVDWEDLVERELLRRLWA